MMPAAAAYEFDRALLNGSGVGEPTGALNAPSAVTVNRGTAGKIAYRDLTAMYSRLHPGFVRGAAWFASPSAFGALLEIRDDAGAFIWQGTPAAADVAMSLFGRPVFVTDAAAALGTRGDVVLADFAAYAVAVKSGVVLERTEAARWNEDIYSFRAILRADGAALLDRPIAPANGDTSLSWCVVLS